MKVKEEKNLQPLICLFIYLAILREKKSDFDVVPSFTFKNVSMWGQDRMKALEMTMQEEQRSGDAGVVGGGKERGMAPKM